MSTLNAHLDHHSTRNRIFSDSRGEPSRSVAAILDRSQQAAPDGSILSILAYMLFLGSAAILIFSGQPPWFLLPAAVALVMASLLPVRRDRTSENKQTR